MKRTWEKPRLATRPSTAPPAITNFFYLLDIFTLYQVHLIVLRGLNRVQKLVKHNNRENYFIFINHKGDNTSPTWSWHKLGLCFRFWHGLRLLHA